MLTNRKSRYAIVAGVAALGSLLAPGVAGAVDAQIVGFTHGGNGCPSGTVGYVFDSANNKLTLNFDKYSATLPPGLSKACNLSFVMKVPRKFQISLNRIEYLGFADLDPGASARLFRTYKYGNNPPISKTTNYPGPRLGTIYLVDTFLGGSACTDQVTVLANSRVDLRGRSNPPHISEFIIDNIQFEGHVIFSFGFIPC